ncbi:hypothetical protein M3O96_19780 [Aquiflexum sp. TKW24L]|uniref:hypothetical protein n=1 Tax=Aquiflexum sp. TKW24L TaxID=2942212 RepID=UPI0020BD477C|nr:hypothetical protein [Aquiflexum sp. TKW24L]MCL6261350.1 hypothetical protein [Aquiflexum sp. TKW24L]
MKKFSILSIFLISTLTIYPNFAQNQKAINPTIHADGLDLSMIGVGDTYYMSSTTK